MTCIRGATQPCMACRVRSTIAARIAAVAAGSKMYADQDLAGQLVIAEQLVIDCHAAEQASPHLYYWRYGHGLGGR